MNMLEEENIQYCQNATLTVTIASIFEPLQIIDDRIQQAFQEALNIFETTFDYQASFEKISQALEVAEPGVTNRFVTSYEKQEKVSVSNL